MVSNQLRVLFFLEESPVCDALILFLLCLFFPPFFLFQVLVTEPVKKKKKGFSNRVAGYRDKNFLKVTRNVRASTHIQGL